MFSFVQDYYYIVFILQAICVIHCLRKGNTGNWIWLIVFLPLIGCIAYIYTEMFSRNQMSQVQAGVGQVFNPSGKIKKLIEQLRFTDTFQNRIALADAYLDAGQFDNAIQWYEDSLTGNFVDNEHANMQLIKAYFMKKDFLSVIRIGQKIKHLAQFARSKAHVYFAIALGFMGDPVEAEKEFQLLNSRFSNYECRYHYALFLQRQGRTDEGKKLLNVLVSEWSHIDNSAKKEARNWVQMAREELKK